MSWFKGILIDQSVSDPRAILENANIISSRRTSLEGEGFRGTVLFYNIEVSEDSLFTVLDMVSETIKNPGWYFHLVNSEKLYVVMPNVIFSAGNNDAELNTIVDYAKSHGIHPDQLNLKQLFDNPFA